MAVNASGATSGSDRRPGRGLGMAEEWSGRLEPRGEHVTLSARMDGLMEGWINRRMVDR